jgi:hypothetical protein
MKCPRCNERMQGERSDFVIDSGWPHGPAKMMPQWHYRCDGCDSEYVRTGWGRLRMLDAGDSLYKYAVGIEVKS